MFVPDQDMQRWMDGMRDNVEKMKKRGERGFEEMTWESQIFGTDDGGVMLDAIDHHREQTEAHWRNIRTIAEIGERLASKDMTGFFAKLLDPELMYRLTQEVQFLSKNFILEEAINKRWAEVSMDDVPMAGSLDPSKDDRKAPQIDQDKPGIAD